MPAEPRQVEAPERLWRVERATTALRFSRISPVDAESDRAGNRFDVPGGGVLYAASDPRGAYAETIAQFRPSALVAELDAEGLEPGRVPYGALPREWRASRRLRALQLVDPRPFVDIDHPATHAFLTREASDVLRALGVGSLDIALVRGPSRTLTRALAGWVYTRVDEHGQGCYSGIRYSSRIGSQECWAVFDGTAVRLVSELDIGRDDEALNEVATQLDIVVS
ncbi:RES family NAD+ phosphorylase [Microbacterium sp.]|uniref:RES family NAD+ phosphorylase n=1 Tax=Microbacterium sp. TaxID=51671 RepID=UPI0039E52734